MKFSDLLQKDLKFGNQFPDKLKQHFYSEACSLIESGIDVRRTVDLLAEEQKKKQVKETLLGIRDKLVKGAALSEALQSSGVFSEYECQTLRVGEETGRLTNVLRTLADYFEARVKLKRQLISVFTYPGFVMLITIGVLYFMLNSVVPMFRDVFSQFGQELPWLTQKIVFLSDHFTTFLSFFAGIILLAGIVFYTQRKTEQFRKVSAQVALRIPVFGQLMRKIYLARFAQMMQLLTESRIPLLRTLDLVEQTIRFYPIEEAVKAAKKDIMAGRQLHEGLAKFPIFDQRLISLVKIAEEINRLDETFLRLTKSYNEDVEHRTKMLGTIIEPAIIVVIGLIVGVIMVSMYLPMFNLSNVIK